jgi:hypothetical protein
MKNKNDQKLRLDFEPPKAITEYGWRYHHLGIPTRKSIPGEYYIEHLKMYVSGFETSPYGIQWMRFDDDCQMSDIVKTLPHVAFEVDDLETAIKGKNLLGEINSPSQGIRVAMIVDDGAPIELIEFTKK